MAISVSRIFPSRSARRRGLLYGAGGLAVLALAALGGIARRSASPSPSADPLAGKEHVFSLTIDPKGGGVPVNRLLLGQNIQWTDGGDDMLDRDGNVRPLMLERLKGLAPTVIRFPGGAQSDTYHWALGMGPAEARKENRHFHSGRMQRTLMGTQEFLELCEAVSAQPFITVNVVTGTPQEAAAWLRQTNVTGLTSRSSGRRLPKVRYWEIGNEPYLKEGEESLWLTPERYVERANAYAKALREVDPDILIGIPLRTPTIAGTPATPYPEFARVVLRGMRERFDFISNHNAYLPYAFDRVPDVDTLYWAAMGSAATVERNLMETRELLAAERPDVKVPQAITEYNALFSLGKGDSDRLVAAPMGALYVADLLRMLAHRDDVMLAQFWSLSGNWMFGAIAPDGAERPAYRVLRMFEAALRGRRLDARMTAATFDSPAVGAAAEARAQPLVTSLVTRDADLLRILLINKHRHRAADGAIRLDSLSTRSARITRLTTRDPTRVAGDASGLAQEEETLAVEAQSVAISLPPASVSLLTLTLAR